MRKLPAVALCPEEVAANKKRRNRQATEDGSQQSEHFSAPAYIRIYDTGLPSARPAGQRETDLLLCHELAGNLGRDEVR